MNEIQEKLKLLPDKPGVYIMLDKDKNVIYVGKARILKNRVRQYFHATLKTEKVAAMVANISDFYYIITKSEIDALSLENNLIKKYKPKYNILLKDDKTYPYIKVSVSERYPNFTISRKLKKGSKYFGPYMLGLSASATMDLIHSVFPVRSCHGNLKKGAKRECLNYHIGRCLAPCCGKVTPEEYRAGHIPGSVNVPLDRLEGVRTVADKTTPLYVYCRSGARSASAAGVLRRSGYEKVTDMAGLMRACDLAVSAAGTTLYELCAAGVPSVSFTMADNQLPCSREMERFAGIPCAGDVRSTPDLIGRLLSLLFSLAENPQKRSALSRSMHAAIDGKGSERIARELLLL